MSLMMGVAMVCNAELLEDGELEQLELLESTDTISVRSLEVCRGVVSVLLSESFFLVLSPFSILGTCRKGVLTG